MSIPTVDTKLATFSANFDARITAAPATFALTAAQATAYSDLHKPYLAAQQAVADARAAGNRSKNLTTARDSAKKALLAYARQLYTFVQASGAVADADKVLLGVHVRQGGHHRRPMPTQRPTVTVVSVETRTVTVAVRPTADGDRKARPAGAVTAWVYTFVGADYPADPARWAFQGAASKSPHPVTFPDTVAGGQKVWVCAAWVNARGEAGPISVPASTYLQGGGTNANDAASEEPAGMRIAA